MEFQYAYKGNSQVANAAGRTDLSFSPDERRVWVALGESARTIVMLTTCVTTCDPEFESYLAHHFSISDEEQTPRKVNNLSNRR